MKCEHIFKGDTCKLCGALKGAVLMGRKGGAKSRRTLTKKDARAMVAAREAKKGKGKEQ